MLLFTLSSWIWGRNKDIGSAVTIANERTRIKSVVKWLIPRSECARAKFNKNILKYSIFLLFYFILYINKHYVVKIIAQTQ